MHRWICRHRLLEIGQRPLLMGIVNVTPDSFSDGGRFLGTDAAIAHGLQMVHEGADILDIGGESTRPGAPPVSLDEELQRVVPVITALAKQTPTLLSVDTAKAAVARQCLLAGAHIVNDVTALSGDADMAAVVREFAAGAILMHMQGTPATMQLDPRYGDVVGDIRQYLAERLQAAEAVGIARECLAVDPGIGFGKTAQHNLEILVRLGELQELGRPLCLGVSRKGFLGRLLDRPVEKRLPGSLAAVCHALSRHAVQIVRVHDVAETRDVIGYFTAVQALEVNHKL